MISVHLLDTLLTAGGNLTTRRQASGDALRSIEAAARGLPPDMLKTIPGYGDVNKDREQARAIMTKLGYGPNNPLKIKVSTRNLATYRDPAVVLIDQLKSIYIQAELDPETLKTIKPG